jgi:hypothetical protein
LDSFIGGFVLRPNGSIAWMKATPSAPFGPHDYAVELHKREAGMESVLASGTDIDPQSLAIKGTRIFWMQAGQPRTAELH